MLIRGDISSVLTLAVLMGVLYMAGLIVRVVRLVSWSIVMLANIHMLITIISLSRSNCDDYAENEGFHLFGNY